MIVRGMECSVGDPVGSFTVPWRRWLLLVVVSGALCLSPAFAAATCITLDSGSDKLSYEATSSTQTITDIAGSGILVRYEHDIDAMNFSKISGGENPTFLFTLNMVKGLEKTDQWSEPGTLVFADSTRDVAMVDFTSRSVMIYSSGPGALQIEGLLSNDLLAILHNPKNSAGDEYH